MTTAITEPTRVDHFCWQLPTEHAGEERYYEVVWQNWSNHRGFNPILVVASVHTYQDDQRGPMGDIAYYMAAPAVSDGVGHATFELMQEVVQHGTKLSEQEAYGLKEVRKAPNGIQVRYRG
jgi:hypothetical protein